MDASWMVAVLLISLRFGAVALLTPPLGAGLVPATIRVAVVLTVSATLAGNVAMPWEPAVIERWGLAEILPAVVRELAFGAAMALGLNMAFAVFTLGARLVDVQIGFGMGQVFDPMTRQQLPILSAIFNQLALVGFFLLDAHHSLMRGLEMSLQHVPPGTGWASDHVVHALVKQATQMFSLGFAIVAPVVACLLLIELGLAVLARNLPQMNTLVLGMPLKVIAGMACLSAWIASCGPLMSKAYRSAFTAWERMWA